ncbi:hypothetical protein PtA15_4A733 [Puccinia triticina]|uniref:Uncharacterized protein n=1 Tax=Puccinia triticina TaxID=208348 RepID=A0ABY7CGR5_9BASI|nr:uncharacterized protein PtA15_4A733 [Puccinia triticina]WAQ84280.1 hypothetical protein PtA15_4A733 [Puccinia triticina]
MHLIKGKMRQEDDSDSDESFHCCGRPEDLLEEFLSSMEASSPDGNEVRVPDDQEYYLYSAGLERLNSPGNGPNPGPHSSIHAYPRVSTVYSSDSDRTRVASPLLIIKTGEVALPSSSRDMSDTLVQLVKPSQPPKPTKKPKWKIQIRPPHGFLRMAISPPDDSPPNPELPTAQTSALHPTPPPTFSDRRRGMVFNPSSLPAQLKELAETEASDGSGT